VVGIILYVDAPHNLQEFLHVQIRLKAIGLQSNVSNNLLSGNRMEGHLDVLVDQIKGAKKLGGCYLT